MARNIFGIIVLWVALRLAVYAAVGQPWGGLAEAMCHFDCDWYERLAHSGYGVDTQFGDRGSYPNWAFFPLYPMLLFGVTELAPWSARLAGVLLSSLFLVGFIAVGAAYLGRLGAIRLPLWIALVLVMPNAHFFSAVYTESLFALLSAGCLLALATGRPLTAALLAALASATRPTGIALTLIIAGERVRHCWRLRHAPDWQATLANGLLPLAIAPLGLSVFMLAQYASVGDAMAFSHVQIDWGRVWRGPVAILADGLHRADWGALAGPMGGPSASYAACWALLGIAVIAGLCWYRHFAEACLLAVCVVLPLATGLDSQPRYVATNPAFLFALYRLLVGRPAWLRGLALLGLAGAHGIMLWAWMSGAGGVF